LINNSFNVYICATHRTLRMVWR